jgi:acetyltransferase-like isoleucine patch superfamily enzyme
MISIVHRIADSARILNAQVQLLGRAHVPLSVRLHGRVSVFGEGELILRYGVSLVGTVVPIELGTYDDGRVEIGEHTFINYGSSITARSSVKIGAHCLLGHYTFIMDNGQHDIIRHNELPPSGPIVIEDHVWIGSKAVILPGVHIGHHAVIGAGSVVTSDVAPHCVVAGSPARFLRQLNNVASEPIARHVPEHADGDVLSRRVPPRFPSAGR